ncbi:unnamed protein product [Linum trigynum]|uniref:Uncharacterized protein n=1 Tax=Linum trigynum TaxID=586398 RepID=A0AAV2DQD8_9ROSI
MDNDGIMDEHGEREEHRLYARVIGYALLHDAQHIAIDLDDGEEPGCSPDFFHLFGSVTKSNIETLQLRAVSFRNSQYSGFGFVTTLDLYYCWVTDLDVFSDSNFPCLENLVMEECSCYKYTRTETISGLNLVSLKLFPVPSQRLEIRAPKLNFLSLAFKFEVKLLKSSLPSLERAEIRLSFLFRFDPDDIEKLQFISLFQDLHNVGSLTLDHLTGLRSCD